MGQQCAFLLNERFVGYKFKDKSDMQGRKRKYLFIFYILTHVNYLQFENLLSQAITK